MLSLLAQAAPLTCPDTSVMFGVSVVVVVSVVVFTAAVIVTLLRRSDRRRVEEEKVAAIGTATARILHQIKNPLQTVVLNADILQDDRIVSSAADRREVCEAIVSESQRLVTMLDELSVYASGARRALNRQPVRLDELVRQVARQEEMVARGTTIRVEAGAEATVFADAYYLRQVFENLVRNAREAMHGQDEPRLVLRVDRRRLGRGAGERQRPRDRAGEGGADLPALRLHQGEGDGAGARHLPRDRGGARRAAGGGVHPGARRHLHRPPPALRPRGPAPRHRRGRHARGVAVELPRDLRRAPYPRRAGGRGVPRMGVWT
jgi:hypothetical protein